MEESKSNGGGGGGGGGGGKCIQGLNAGGGGGGGGGGKFAGEGVYSYSSDTVEGKHAKQKKK